MRRREGREKRKVERKCLMNILVKELGRVRKDQIDSVIGRESLVLFLVLKAAHSRTFNWPK